MAVLALLLYPPGCKGEMPGESGPMEKGNVLATAGKVDLGAGPTTVTLGGPELAARLDALGSRRVHVVLRGLHASQPPGVLYHLYLNLPAGAVPAGEDPRHVGIVNFYAAQTGPADPDRIFYSFDATDAARSLRAQSLLRDGVTLTFLPVGSPAPEAGAGVSRIELTAD